VKKGFSGEKREEFSPEGSKRRRYMRVSQGSQGNLSKGIVFLKRKKEVWNWMPALERTIKLPPSMMSQNWMGTDFTNGDLVQNLP
jgi:hypothetical protein